MQKACITKGEMHLALKENQEKPNCIHCNSNSYVKPYITVQRDIPSPYFICRKCGLIFEDPKLHQETDFDFSKSAKNLTEDDMSRFKTQFVSNIKVSDDNGRIYPSYRYNNPNDMILGIFERVNNIFKAFGFGDTHERFSLLEVGCANGFLLEEIKKHYPAADLRGLDPSPIECEKAQNKGLSVICGTMDTVNFKGKKFDVVIMIGNLMLHKNPYDTLSRIRHIMKNSGLLIFDVKNSKASIRILAKCLYNIPFIRSLNIVQYIIRRSYGMRYFFTKPVLHKALPEIGFRIIKLTTKPPRLLEFPNRYTEIKGYSKLLWRVSDIIDRCFNQRAWIEVCCESFYVG